MTPNVENLEKLHDIITQVPPEHFGMDTFFKIGPSSGDSPIDIDQPIAEIIQDCSSVGCMIGWGAIDLDLNPSRFEFYQFTDDVLGMETFSDLWEALFSGEWGVTDYYDNPVVLPADQKRDALSRLAYVIKQLEDDPDWTETAPFEDWVVETHQELRAINILSENYCGDGDDDDD